LDRLKIFFGKAGSLEQLQIFRAVDADDAFSADLVPDAFVVGGEFVHHHAAVLAVADLECQRRHAASFVVARLHSFGPAEGLHAGNQFGVGALGFDEGDNGSFFAARVFGDKAAGQVTLAQASAIQSFDGVFLNGEPLVAAFAQGLDVFVGDIRMVGKVHFRRGESAHAAQGVPAENGGELLLPSEDVQLEVGN